MKKTLTLLLTILLVLGTIGCDSSKNNAEPSNSSPSLSTPSPTSTPKPSPTPKTLSDSEVESLATRALYNQLSKNQASKYDIDQTTFSIASVKKDDANTWVVKGTFSLYNDYGQYKKSGTFTAYVHTNGGDFCLINLK